MKRLVNHGARRLGVAGRPAIILNPNQSKKITDVQEAHLLRNRTVNRWLETGVLEIVDDDEKRDDKKPTQPKRRAAKPKVRRPDPDERKDESLPEGVTGEGVELHHRGGGWYEVFVNGFKVTDRNVRKDEAQSIASEYETNGTNG